jgi:alkylation response protein AidB-like acyl-CoA dehydrogenase
MEYLFRVASITAHAAHGLSAEQRAIGELAFELGRKYGERAFDDHEASMSQWDDLATSGLTGLSIPEEHGGAGGMFDLIIAAERLSAGGYPAAKLVIATAIAGSVLARAASPAQQKRWLPGVADGSIRFAFALTEPGAGSNSRKLQTTAVKTEGGWRVRGEKTYISALESSDAMVLVAKDVESGGLSLFAFPLPHPGIEWTQVNVLAPAFEYQWSVFFDAVLPDESLIGEPGGGSKALFTGLNPERLIVAAQAVGIGRWCLERAREYAGQRVVFDVPIGAHQAIQHPLAEAFIAVEAAWLLLERACRLYDAGEDAGVESNMAKIAACDAGLKAADRALQTFGGSGFTDQTMILQRFTYMRLLQTIPVARELALNHIATAGLGLPRSY